MDLVTAGTQPRPAAVAAGAVAAVSIKPESQALIRSSGTAAELKSTLDSSWMQKGCLPFPLGRQGLMVKWC